MNTQIYDKNMCVLKKKYPEIAQRVENVKEEIFSLVVSANKSHYNIHSKEGKFYYYDNNNPLQDCRTQIEELELKNARIVVFLGLGLGYELGEYMKNEQPKQNSKNIFIIEKNVLFFKYAMYANDLSEAIENDDVFFLVGEKEEYIFTLLRDFVGRKGFIVVLFKTLKPVYHTSSINLYKEYYLKVLSIIKDVFVYQMCFYGNSPQDSIWGIENMFKNLGEIIRNPGIIMLKDKFKGLPGLVLGSGPSLKKVIHLLEGIKDKVVMVSAESTLRALVHHGLKPNMVASLERTDVTIASFVDFSKEQVDDVYLAGCPVIPKGAYEAYPGPRLVVYRQYDHFSWLKIDKGMLNIKQSSGNMAFKIADYMGCDPILIVGQDLCFANDGEATHIEGAQGGHNQKMYHDSKIMEVPGNTSSMVKTSDIWYEFLLSYEIDVAESTAKCINCTENGVKILGANYMNFEDAVKQYLTKDIFPSKIIKDAISDFDLKNVQEDFQKIIDLLEKDIPKVEEIMSVCEEGLEVFNDKADFVNEFLENKKEITPENELELLDISKKLYALKVKVQTSSDTFQLLLMHVLQSFIVKFEMDINSIPEKHEDGKLAQLEIMMTHRKWFAIVHDITGIVLKLLIQSKEEIEVESKDVEKVESFIN